MIFGNTARCAGECSIMGLAQTLKRETPPRSPIATWFSSSIAWLGLAQRFDGLLRGLAQLRQRLR